MPSVAADPAGPGRGQWRPRQDDLGCVRIVERGSFAAAAAGRGFSATMVGDHVRFLEERLDASLLNRTTRRHSLTEFGRSHYERCRAVLADIESAEGEAGAVQATPRGLLRVTAPAALGTTVLPRLLAGHLYRHPEVSVDLVLQDHRLDLVADEIDIAIRASALPDSSLHRPHPVAHAAEQRHWRFAVTGGEAAVGIGGNLRVNSGQALRAAALEGGRAGGSRYRDAAEVPGCGGFCCGATCPPPGPACRSHASASPADVAEPAPDPEAAQLYRSRRDGNRPGIGSDKRTPKSR